MLASKVLVGAKDGVYQVFMAQVAPVSVLTLLAGGGRPAVAELAPTGPAAADVSGRFQIAARSQNHQAAVDGPRAGACKPTRIHFPEFETTQLNLGCVAIGCDNDALHDITLPATTMGSQLQARMTPTVP